MTLVCRLCEVTWSASHSVLCWQCKQIGVVHAVEAITEEIEADLLLADLIEWNRKRRKRTYFHKSSLLY